MRYFVKNRDGQELVVPSLADLHGLYAQGFLDDEDLVRAESSTRWVPAGKLATLGGVRLRRREPGYLLQLLLLAAIAVVAVVTGAYRNLGALGLILLVTLASFFAWSRWRR